MSRLVRRRRTLTVVATTLLALAVPAAAHAATYTVKAGDGACGGGDLACGGLIEAAAAANNGDIFNVATGTYPSAKFTATVEIRGDLGFAVDGTLEFAGGGVSKISKVAATQGNENAPAIYVSNGSLELSDAIVVSKNGFGVLITSGQANKIVRSVIATGGALASAVQVNSGTGTAEKALTIDSSAMSGGKAGVGAETTNAELEAAAGNIVLNLHHITAVGSTNGINLDSSGARRALGVGVGNITATVRDSLAFNNRVVNYAGVLNLGVIVGANTATLDAERTIQSGDPNEFFLDPSKGNFRLRPDATKAIGQGGFTPGESTTDIDGEDRSAAPTDLGADEYNNAAPVAKIKLATATPRTTQPVTFDGRSSADRDGQATIAEYRWRFSDGTATTTTQPFVQHAFAAEGDAAAGLVVVDKQGAASPEDVVTFKLINGVAPAVGIVKPKSKQTFRTYTTTTKTVTKNGKKVKTKTRKRTKIIIAGLSKPAAGTTQRILLTLQKTKSTTSTKQCRYYDATRGLRLVSCDKPILITARLIKDSKSGEWTYGVPTARPLSTGSWKVSAYGVDSTGAFGNSADPKAATITFTVKK